ncbi:hypothetical protein [Rubrivirga sp. IMCC45206]|uniref:hypothetical protein n=1 Tax=Rubrivirga sp. IMCC45206 TaxID=3391614 RepID=UPI0039900B78
MVASILSVVAGYVTWTLVFLGGSAGLRAAFGLDADGRTDRVGVLLAYLTLSVIASVGAGAVSARLAPRRPMRHVWVLAVLLLATGIPVQMASWALLPAWYHLAFLLALVPATVLGGRWMAGERR